MAKLTPVNHDPFAAKGPKLTPVDKDPFTGHPVQPSTGREAVAEKIGGAVEPYLEAGREIVSNIPRSAVEYGKNMAYPFAHPVETAKGVYKIISGFAGSEENEGAKNQFVDMLASRYGSLEAFDRTIRQDPVGAIADLATVFAAGGGALKLAGKASGAAPVASAGQTLSKVANAVDPVNMAREGVRKAVVAATPESLAANMYQSAAKFPTTMDPAQRTKIVNTALDEGIMPTQSGVEKAKTMIDDLNEQVISKIDAATQSGQRIAVDDLFQYLDDVRANARLSGEPVANLKAINRIEEQIRGTWGGGQKKPHQHGAKPQGLVDQHGRPIPSRTPKQGKVFLDPKEAQRIKQNIYKEVNYASEKVLFKDDAKKAVARAAKVELEKIYPELKGLNAKEGALLSLLEEIERSANRISNRDFSGIGLPIKGTAGSSVGGSLGGELGAKVGAVVGLAQGILDVPSVKARIAIAIRQAKRGEMSRKGAAVRSAAFQTGRAAENNEEQ